MLSLGDADSFIIEYVDVFENKYIVLIDAGEPKHGKIVADHLTRYYKTDKIDLAVSTHLDSDHIGGFTHIVNNFRIDEFWIHDPREYYSVDGVNKIIKNAGKIAGLRTLTESIRQSKSLNELLDQHKEIYRVNPIPGLQHENIPIVVLGPSEDYYISQLRKFKDLENLDESVLDGKSINRIVNAISSGNNTMNKLTNPANNSSIIMVFQDEDFEHLFTADAGVEAIEEALSKYKSLYGKRLSNILWFDVPHHGSINNLSKDIINELSPYISFISASGQNEHPSREIIENLSSIGSIVYCTSHSGNTFFASFGSDETGYKLADPITEYEDNANNDDQDLLLKSVFKN